MIFLKEMRYCSTHIDIREHLNLLDQLSDKDLMLCSFCVHKPTLGSEAYEANIAQCDHCHLFHKPDTHSPNVLKHAGMVVQNRAIITTDRFTPSFSHPNLKHFIDA